MFGFFAPFVAILFVISGIAVLFERGFRLASLTRTIKDPSRVQTIGFLGAGLSGLLAAIKVMIPFSIGFWVCLAGGIAAGAVGVRALVRSGAKGAASKPVSAPAGDKQEAGPRTYWTNRPAKLVTVGSLFALAFIFSAPIPFYIVAVGWFPLGFLFWLNGAETINGQPSAWFYSVLFWGWALYFTISITIVRSTNKNLIRLLLVVLVVLLAFNARGCQVQAVNYF